MDIDKLKALVAEAAVTEIRSNLTPNSVLGIGTGSTTNIFIERLGTIKEEFEGAVASSKASEKKLIEAGIRVYDINSLKKIDVYVDGADEADRNLCLTKGGGGALTREKIVSSAAEKFICIIDYTKEVETLGKFPIPIEVIPMAMSLVEKRIHLMGGFVTHREGFITDNGNIILDAHNLDIPNPLMIEDLINGIPGVVTVGLFAKERPDLLLIAMPDGKIQTKQQHVIS